MRSLAIAFVLLLGAGGPAGWAQQTITPLNAPAEQRVEAIGGDGVQTVQPIDEAELQNVMHQEPPSAAGQVAHTAAKVGLGIFAAAASIGFMVASLLFI